MILDDPTHILKDSSSCIDLTFTSQPNLVKESGIHCSLHPNYHHHIVYAKFRFKIYYPSPYKREVWRYGKTKIDLVRKAINSFSSDKAFKNLKFSI